MQYTQIYASPVGDLLLACDDKGLTGVWFSGGRYFAEGLSSERAEQTHDILALTKKWFDVYFSGREPDFMPPRHLTGSEFRKTVGKIMLTIPFGKTVSYGEIARQKGIKKMSAQAVGHNPISIIIPCHRVVGINGSLTGYGGGIARKIKLLTLEGADMAKLFVPKTGTAL